LLAIGLIAGSAKALGELARAAGVTHDWIVERIVAVAGKWQALGALLYD
jgi:hypothetical protein